MAYYLLKERLTILPQCILERNTSRYESEIFILTHLETQHKNYKHKLLNLCAKCKNPKYRVTQLVFCGVYIELCDMKLYFKLRF